jgi:hypothetical protein
MINDIPKLTHKHKQKESGSRLLTVGLLLLAWAVPAVAQDRLDAGGLSFKDFGTADRGASFNRTDPMLPEGPGPATARLLEIDSANGLARIRFEPVKIDIAVPLGWQAFQEAERGIAYNADRSYRLIVWRVDFTFEGVRDAEHYAATKGGTIRSRYPNAKVQAHKLSDGSFLIVYENVPASQGDQEPRTVFDVVIPNPSDAKAGVLMTLGVPTSQAERGLKLVSLLKKTIKITW